MAAEGVYAVHLNTAFYQRHIPFYDSCSYLDQMAEIFTISRQQGLSKAVATGLNGNVALPWLESALLAKVTEPSRAWAVWIQWVWLAALALSLYWYFTKLRAIQPWQAVFLCLPFVAFESALRWNGGLEDFRMDLSSYIFLALTAVWYLIAVEGEVWAPWLIAGGFGALAILARSLAPVYLAVMLGPLVVWELALAGERRTKLGLRVGAMAAMTLPGFAYLLWNYRYLSFYYGSSPDANAHLPFRQRLLHAVLACAHVGAPLAAACVIWFAVHMRKFWREQEGSIDWRLAYLGIAPPLLLIARGAGLNPFVSMPAVFGILAFAFLPLRGADGKPGVPIGLFFLLPAACLVNYFTVDARLPLFAVDETRASGTRTVISTVMAGANTMHQTSTRYAIPAVGDFNSCAFENALIFERAGVVQGGTMRLPEGFSLGFPDETMMAVTNPIFWNMEPGVTERDKVHSVESLGLRNNFLLLPSDSTIPYLERTRPFNLINMRIREMKAWWLASGRLVKLGEAAYISPDEAIEVYAVR